MKVTVCFGSVRILVPCGSGDLLVKDLIAEATKRFKKASGKEPGSWVAVHHLQTQSGILDPDDCVRDVADDREHIIATFEDSGPDPGVPQGGGDGASGSSSVGTGSPDIFRDPTNTEAPTNGNQHGDVSTPHIEVTSTTVGPLTGLGLQVRRSSDPNLLASLKADNGNKRWSAAAPHCAGESPERVRLEKNGYLPPQWEEDDDIQNQVPVNAPAQQPFARSGRLSMQFLGDGTGYKWMDAAEKLQLQQQHQHQPQPIPQNPHHNYNQHQNQIFSSKSLPRESKRKEPLGQAYESIREKDGEMLLIINEHGSPLGLTAIPDNEHGGGLLVLYVEPGSRAERGRLRKGDRILEINGTKLIGLTENKVQEYLKKALESYELRVRVIRSDQKGGKSRRRDSKVAEMIEAEERYAGSTESKVAAVSPTRKPHTAPVGTSLQVANTRKLGRKIEIILKKGPNGLGFSVTTRDNPAGGDCPIYIKNILPRGAAIEDGRLKPGDRLLEIDGVPMTGKTQADVVSILRATTQGATVRIIVSRQQELSEDTEKKPKHDEEKEYIMNTPPKPPPPVLPSSAQKHQSSPATQNSHPAVQKSSSARSLFEQHQQHQQQNLNESQHFIDAGSESAASSDSLQAGIAWRSREVLTFHIPVHDTEKAGLGVSVKGKTTHNTTSSSSGSGSNGSMKHDGDLGIFVKNVIHGGAASRDGRLRMNDQLLSVNGVSLLGQNNAEAMETLRRAMVNNPGKHPGMITLTVARKIARSASSGDIIEQANSSSNTSENSGATVIYLTPVKKDARDGGGNGQHHGHYEKNRFSNPILDRLTRGVCSSNSNTNGQKERRSSRDNLLNAPATAHGLRNDSYYMATNESWSPAVHLPNGHGNNSLLFDDEPEPSSPTLPKRPNDSSCTQSSMNTTNPSGVVSFDATYSSQLSLETNNSGMDHFSRDALGRRSISEKHHAALDARETGTYQRNKKIREERERERRIQLTKSAVFGSMESLTARIAQANAQIPGYKHAKTTSGIEAQQLQAEAQDQVGDLGPSLGLKKSSSLESLQTMVQEIQMSDEPRGPTALRAPRGRGREESLRAAVTGDNTGKPRKTWLLEDADGEGGFTNRNGPFQSSLNDGKSKSRAKKPSILRGIGHMFRFGKNRKDGVVPAELQPATNQNERANIISAPVLTNTTSNIAANKQANNQIPVAALSALERNTKLPPPAYQPPPPLGVSSNNNSSNSNSGSGGGGGSVPNGHALGLGLGGIHQNDIFNHRYQHYANYEEIPQQQISRRHQHYHSQRSARSQDINLHSQAIINNINHGNLNGNSVVSAMGLRPSSYFEYETIQQNVTSIQHHQQHHQQQQQQQQQQHQHLHQQQNQKAQQQHPQQQQRNGSIKQNGHSSSPITVNGGSLHHPQMNGGSVAAIPHWKQAALNGFSPSSLNSSARSRGPFITQVTIRDQTSPTYQTIQKPPLPPLPSQPSQPSPLQQQQQQQQIQQNSNPAASKV